ncbi:hypothetical protein JCM6882_008134 [Rhodosporidiobolus microsporus]
MKDAGEVDIYALPATNAQSAATLGPCAIGWEAALLLYGVYLVVHTQYVRSAAYSRIRWQVKTVLWAVCFFLTAHTGLMVAELTFWTTNSTHRKYGHVLTGFRFESFPPLAAGLVAAPVQTLLMLRTASLLKNSALRWTFLIWTSLAILFGLTSAILACAVNLYYFEHGGVNVPGLSWSRAMAMLLWANASTDVLVFILLTMTLKHRIAGFDPNMDGLVTRLVVSGLQTAIYTAVFSVAGAVLSAIFGDWSVYGSVAYAFWSQLPACYGISLYTTLSTRRTVEEYIATSIPLPGAKEHDLFPASDSIRRSETGKKRDEEFGVGLGGRRGEKRDLEDGWEKGEEAGLTRSLTPGLV